MKSQWKHPGIIMKSQRNWPGKVMKFPLIKIWNIPGKIMKSPNEIIRPINETVMKFAWQYNEISNEIVWQSYEIILKLPDKLMK